jgi:gluconate 2-dehydrogenase alpha chain
MATGRYEIRTHSKVLRVDLGRDGLATGVTYLDVLTGEEHTQPADMVILSAFTLENIRLMLLSRNPRHPNGIGNDRGLVGKNYTYQLDKSPVTGLFAGRRLNLYMGNSCLQEVMHDFNADNFDHSDLDFIGGASIACGGGERQPLTSTLGIPVMTTATSGSSGDEDDSGNQGQRKRPPISAQVSSLAGSGTEWGQEWKENLRANWDSYAPINIQGESLPYEDQFLDLDPTYKDAYGLPLLRITFDWHENDYKLYRFIAARCREIMAQMGPTRYYVTPELEPYDVYSYQSTHNTGGAIMGSDPGNSVTNKYGQVWDTPNVFVTGAALYPQNPGMNPTGPLFAHTYLAGDGMRDSYLREPGQVIG